MTYTTYTVRKIDFLLNNRENETRFKHFCYILDLIEQTHPPITSNFGLSFINILVFKEIKLVNGLVLGNFSPDLDDIGGIEDYSEAIAIYFAPISGDPIWWKSHFAGYGFRYNLAQEIITITEKIKAINYVINVI